MKLLLDTNVVLDVLLDRAPFAHRASQLLSRCELRDVTGCLCATTVTTIHYLVAKAAGEQIARRHLKRLLSILDIAPVTRAVLDAAVNSPFDDFEDAVIHEAARLAGVQAIVTRDGKGYAKSFLPVYAPGDCLGMLVGLKRIIPRSTPDS